MGLLVRILILLIFITRVVNEINNLATRKNKEWKDKLPNVVLKAEEIMYSKANSEAEYMDLEILWDRANDAINTIIRLDESTDGVFLQVPLLFIFFLDESTETGVFLVVCRTSTCS
ncbi:hypothetical protein HanXRQr2_Chr10g0428711 [Helianthus annuus]|uniref:Uncharacterized protein n=1 Tax=Helianthus annuus TaxID=4232 RepID=A0A251TID4_HELAN|nr:hypothetical protein HanXRQr2_Chr10g0428711 [Helianthus annuus]KAJ0513001.1 hypothetical protein HanHA300_Chr10g0352511 [Helianthus annuus]KAJ0529121.1 hypothetical protein HanHA89_Chr10g0374161 [Helianthus annuus]KAJ0696003.1 hypothetical protein HanLR1_Chr10g0352011 [Helianthus annuus]